MHEPPDDRSAGLWQRHAHPDHLAAPEQPFDELGVHGQRQFPVRFRNEDMDVLLIRRHRDEDLATHPERAEVMVRRFCHFRQCEGQGTDGSQLQWRPARR